MLVAIYKTGSSLLLDNPRDEDYVYYYETEHERLDALINNTIHDINIHFETVSTAQRITVWCYLYPLMEHIQGEDLELDTFNLFDHEEEYRALLKQYVSYLPRESKQWYHILIGVYMLVNRKMKLTKTQLAKVQKVHDDQCIDEENYNYVMEKLA